MRLVAGDGEHARDSGIEHALPGCSVGEPDGDGCGVSQGTQFESPSVDALHVSDPELSRTVFLTPIDRSECVFNSTYNNAVSSLSADCESMY